MLLSDQGSVSYHFRTHVGDLGRIDDRTEIPDDARLSGLKGRADEEDYTAKQQRHQVGQSASPRRSQSNMGTG